MIICDLEVIKIGNDCVNLHVA